MMRNRAAVALLVLAASRDALACAPAPHVNERVAIVEESAAIVWEPAAKREHFIRRATFHGEARDFGFLVPTPTVPGLQEVDGALFDLLETRTRRQQVYETERDFDFTPLVLAFTARSKAIPTTNNAGGVHVLATQNLAGYEAAVLEASDAAALHEWLDAHGYATTPDLEEWLGAYVRQGWKITAFKIDKRQDAAARSAAVKMSFVTDRPFFPYREPASQRETPEDRSLRVWFLGPERVSGSVGANAWNAELLWSSDPGAAWLRDFARQARVAVTSPLRLSAFADTQTPRPGVEDLFFARAADQNAFVPPPEVLTSVETFWVPLDVVALPLLAAAFVVWRVRRRRKGEY